MLKETFAKYKHILGYGLLILALLVSLSYNVNRPIQRSMSQLTTIASSSAMMTPTATLAATMTSTKCHARMANQSDPQSIEPDPNCTPGSINLAVTQNTLKTTICTVGYTAIIRPPVAYTEKLKEQGMAMYGFTDSIKLHEEDHLIALELGGNPTDPKNLWPEPFASPNEKDSVESYLHQQVCLGNIPLATAQKEIATEWYTIYQTLHN